MLEYLQVNEWTRPVIVTDMVLCFIGAFLLVIMPLLTTWFAKLALRLMILCFAGGILLGFVYVWMATQ